MHEGKIQEKKGCHKLKECLTQLGGGGLEESGYSPMTSYACKLLILGFLDLRDAVLATSAFSLHVPYFL